MQHRDQRTLGDSESLSANGGNTLVSFDLSLELRRLQSWTMTCHPAPGGAAIWSFRISCGPAANSQRGLPGLLRDFGPLIAVWPLRGGFLFLKRRQTGIIGAKTADRCQTGRLFGLIEPRMILFQQKSLNSAGPGWNSAGKQDETTINVDNLVPLPEVAHAKDNTFKDSLL